MRHPGNYGFIPHTLSEDGDPCDVVVCNTRAIAAGAVIACRPVGVLMMEDEAGLDEKILAVPVPKLTPGGAQIGNVPQALTNLAPISAAYTLGAALDRKGPPGDSWRQF